MGIGEPKTNIDFAALKARLKASVDQSVDMAQSSAPVSPSSDPKYSKQDKHQTGGRGNGENGGFKANELEDLKKKGNEYISVTKKEITQAKSVEELMVLVDDISSKSSRKRLGLKLSNGLAALLSVDTDFTKKFDALVGQWEKRIVKVLFDDAHQERFRDFLGDVEGEAHPVEKNRFCRDYLDRYGLSILWEALPVRMKLASLWDEYLPFIQQELRKKKSAKRDKNQVNDANAVVQPIVDQLSVSPDGAQPGDNQVPLPGSKVSTLNKSKPFIPSIDMDDAVRDARNAQNNGGLREDEREAFQRYGARTVRGKNLSLAPDGVEPVVAYTGAYPELYPHMKDIAGWEEKATVLLDEGERIIQKMSVLQALSAETKEKALKGWIGEQIGIHFSELPVEKRAEVVEFMLKQKK